MLDLKNVTFVIPTRIDSTNRLNNLNIILKYLNNHFDTNIIVGEEFTNLASNLKFRYEYKYFNYNCGFFHRTRLLNNLFSICKTDIVVNYDSDVLFDISSYTNSVQRILSDKYDMVFPYNGLFYDVSEIYHKKIYDDVDISFLKNIKHRCRNNNSFGGCIFFNRQSLIKSGMENENFKSWGFEDNERVIRFDKLGLKYCRLEGCLYHLKHPKFNDSSKSNPYYQQNKEELEKISNMSKEEIILYMGLDSEYFR